VADGGAALERGGVKPVQGWSGAGEAGQGDGVVWTERCGARPGSRERSRCSGCVAGLRRRRSEKRAVEGSERIRGKISEKIKKRKKKRYAYTYKKNKISLYILM